MLRWIGRLMSPAVLLLGAAGCAHTAISGEGGRYRQEVRGEMGVVGDDHKITILAGSEVTKLSIMGEDNHIIVEDGATINKIEIVGEDNEVVCPAGEAVEFSEIGEGNRLKYRAGGG